MREHMSDVREEAPNVSSIKDLLALIDDLSKMYEQSGHNELVNKYVVARDGGDTENEKTLESQIMLINTAFQDAVAALDERLHELLPSFNDLMTELLKHDAATMARLMKWWMATTLPEAR